MLFTAGPINWFAFWTNFREERLRFWSDPDTELKLAKDTGVRVFRMGIDWTRVMPKEPLNGLKESVRLMLTITIFSFILMHFDVVWKNPDAQYKNYANPLRFSMLQANTCGKKQYNVMPGSFNFTEYMDQTLGHIPVSYTHTQTHPTHTWVSYIIWGFRVYQYVLLFCTCLILFWISWDEFELSLVTQCSF